MEQAGGRASTGTQNLLDVVPQALHARTPLIIGSKEDVALVESFIQDRGRQSQEGLQVSLG
jgi:fructose-1,6-bisphosphatase I